MLLREAECRLGLVELLAGRLRDRRDPTLLTHAELAEQLITQGRKLYADEDLGLDLTNTVYALDSTTIALCLSVFPWAHFRTIKVAMKMHILGETLSFTEALGNAIVIGSVAAITIQRPASPG